MDTSTTIQLSLLCLIFLSLSVGLYTLIKTLNKIHQQQQNINQSLENIAGSQRILAKNPRDFEETKRISQLKRD